MKTSEPFRHTEAGDGGRWLRPWRRLLTASIIASCVAGCHSTDKPPPKPASAQFASVELQGNTPGQISQMAMAVFQENGFKVALATPNQLVFEKEGTAWNNLAYGNWESDQPIWVRVKASIVYVSEASYRLECHAFLVRDKGKEVFEEEIKVRNINSGRYQKLLDEVARRLGH